MSFRQRLASPSELLAAFLYAQLEAPEKVQARRAAIWERYYAGLGRWAAASGVTLPRVPPQCDQACHLAAGPGIAR